MGALVDSQNSNSYEWSSRYCACEFIQWKNINQNVNE